MQKAYVCKINFKNNYIFICLRGFIGAICWVQKAYKLQNKMECQGHPGRKAF